MREPFQALVLLFAYGFDTERRYCIFKRKKGKYWQFLSGGKEKEDNEIQDTVIREVFEEVGLMINRQQIIALETTTCISPEWFGGQFGKDVLLVTEKCFAVRIDLDVEIVLSDEHSAYQWVTYSQAMKKLKWDSNKVALYELNRRLSMGE